jgi:hypothetical protein
MNTKMKVLSLALIGAFGYVGSAAAGTCPAGPTVAEGGAWTSKVVLPATSTLAISAGGLDASACKLDSAIGPSASAISAVQDDTPTAEPRYRAQFLVNPDALGNFTATDLVQVFTANSQTAYPAAGGRRQILVVNLSPGAAGAKRLTFVASCDNIATNNRCFTSSGDLPAGASRVEVDLQIGASGSVRYWVNAAAGTSEPAPSGSITVTGGNAGWVGVESGLLGLTAPSPAFKNNHATQIVSFDTFDSRRTTYIGS